MARSSALLLLSSSLVSIVVNNIFEDDKMKTAIVCTLLAVRNNTLTTISKGTNHFILQHVI